MGAIKGKIQYDKWKSGKELTRKESMLAMCYQCNGLEESAEDCLGKDCPMYQFQHYRSTLSVKRHFLPSQKTKERWLANVKQKGETNGNK